MVVNWRQPLERPANATQLHNTQPSAALAEISPTDTSPDESDESVPPSEAPEPTSQGQATEPPASPITIGSADEENVGSRNNATEPSGDEEPAETIASMSEGDKTQEECMDATPTSPSTNAVTRTAEQREQMEGEQAEETESGTTDEVIALEVLGEANPEHAASSPYEPKETKWAQAATQSFQQTPTLLPPAGATAEMEKTGTKRPASIASLQETDERQALSVNARAGTSEDLKDEGGHPCGCLLSAGANTTNLPSGEAKRRNRWAPTSLAVSAAPPQGVDPESNSSNSPTSPAEQQNKVAAEAPAPQTAMQPKPQVPLAVKSKAAKPALNQPGRASTPEAIHSRLHAPPALATGLLSIAAARPPAAGVTNPQMPVTPTEDPSTHSPTKAAAHTTEIYIQETEEQSGSVNTDITHLAEQRAMQMVHRYQTLSVEVLGRAQTETEAMPAALPPVAPPVSSYANLPQEWPLARLSVQLRHIGVLLRVTLYRRLLSSAFAGSTFGICRVRSCEIFATTLITSAEKWPDA